MADSVETNIPEAPKTGRIRDLFSAGAHFAFSKSRRHPSVKPFIFGAKNNVEIFDLEKTNELLEKAAAFAESLGAERKTILFVGTKHEAVDTVRQAAETLDMPVIITRWSGGILTNFKEIRRRIDLLENLRASRASGELERKYTKKERVMLGREIERLETKFGGIVSVKEMPAALFIVDPRHEHNALGEAHVKNIPVIALMGSDCDVSEVTYPILGNDNTRASVKFFVDAIVEAYKKGLARAPIAPTAKAE